MNTQLLRTASRSLAAAALLALSALPSYAQEKPAAHQDYEAPKVGKLEVVGTTPTTISLKWTPATDNKTPQNKLRYILWVAIENEVVSEIDLGTNIESYTVRALHAGHNNYVNLLVMDEEGNVAYYCPLGEELSADTDSPVSGKMTAEPATIETIGSTSIALKWKPATSDQSKQEHLVYTVYWYEVKNPGTGWDTKQIGDILIGKTSYTIEQLRPTTEYKIQVVAHDEMGNTVGVLNTNITTLPDEEIPIIRKFTTSQLRHNAVHLNWETEDNITHAHQFNYAIQYAAKNLGISYYYPIKRGAKELELRWLKPDTKYTLTFIATDAARNIAWKEIEFTTPPVPDYEAPKASEWIVGEATDKSLRLLWTAATDNKTAQEQLRYRVGWKAKGEKEWTYSAVNPADWKKGITNFVIEDLKANTEYDVELFVMDEAENITSYGEKKGRTAVPNAIESVKAVQNKTAEVYGLDGTLRQEGVEEQPIGVYIMEGKKVIKP